MKISDEQLAEFQRLYKKYFGEELSQSKALEEGLKLVRFIKLISEE